MPRMKLDHKIVSLENMDQNNYLFKLFELQIGLQNAFTLIDDLSMNSFGQKLINNTKCSMNPFLGASSLLMNFYQVYYYNIVIIINQYYVGSNAYEP